MIYITPSFHIVHQLFELSIRFFNTFFFYFVKILSTLIFFKFFDFIYFCDKNIIAFLLYLILCALSQIVQDIYVNI